MGGNQVAQEGVGTRSGGMCERRIVGCGQCVEGAELVHGRSMTGCGKCIEGMWLVHGKYMAGMHQVWFGMWKVHGWYVGR